MTEESQLADNHINQHQLLLYTPACTWHLWVLWCQGEIFIVTCEIFIEAVNLLVQLLPIPLTLNNPFSLSSRSFLGCVELPSSVFSLGMCKARVACVWHLQGTCTQLLNCRFKLLISACFGCSRVDVKIVWCWWWHSLMHRASLLFHWQMCSATVTRIISIVHVKPSVPKQKQLALTTFSLTHGLLGVAKQGQCSVNAHGTHTVWWHVET